MAAAPPASPPNPDTESGTVSLFDPAFDLLLTERILRGRLRHRGSGGAGSTGEAC